MRTEFFYVRRNSLSYRVNTQTLPFRSLDLIPSCRSKSRIKLENTVPFLAAAYNDYYKVSNKIFESVILTVNSGLISNAKGKGKSQGSVGGSLKRKRSVGFLNIHK